MDSMTIQHRQEVEHLNLEIEELKKKNKILNDYVEHLEKKHIIWAAQLKYLTANMEAGK